MLYSEIIAVCSQIHTKHKHTVWAERRIQAKFLQNQKNSVPEWFKVNPSHSLYCSLWTRYFTNSLLDNPQTTRRIGARHKNFLFNNTDHFFIQDLFVTSSRQVWQTFSSILSLSFSTSRIPSQSRRTELHYYNYFLSFHWVRVLHLSFYCNPSEIPYSP
jgi:hypothetical protein